jgi:tetratricopeptide (TPR) repeat protein
MRRALRKRPDSLDAYDFVLRGLDLLYRLGVDDFGRARDMFQRAMDLDPGYAAPYALTSVWHSIRIGQGWSDDPPRDYDAIARLASAAIDRDPFDARALALCGHVRALRLHDYDGAFALFDRAVAAAPSSSEAWVRSSPAYSYVGDGAEARRRAEHALTLSPFDAHLFYTHTAIALARYTLGEFEEAAAWGRKAVSQNPRYTAALRILTASLAAAGRTEEAAPIGRALLELEPGFRVESFCRSYAYRERHRLDALASHFRAAGLPD